MNGWKTRMKINVIGGGLAGCEAAWQAANAGAQVTLYEMKPEKYSPAHHSQNMAELVCSNSLKASRVESAAGLLKEEMRRFHSLLMECADQTQVPAGGALAVDRDEFSSLVTRKIKGHENIQVVSREVTELPLPNAEEPTVVATGPLTSDALAEKIAGLCGGSLSFFDAAAPIVTYGSVDLSQAFTQSRYDKGEDDAYLNCPMNKEQYEAFYQELIRAERAPVHEFDVNNPKVYEGCMPVEVMAQRGADTLRFGPLKPVGLRDPRTGHRPWAVVQLRQENREKTLYNLVGFQTNLRFPEQRRVFSMIPALKNAEFVRYGVMHRNTFIDSPRLLRRDFSMTTRPDLFFAGQLTGLEGYLAAMFSGLLAGKNAVRRCQGRETLVLPRETMMGALSHYISDESVKDFQPMGANFGILPPLQEPIRDKRRRYGALSERSLERIEKIINSGV